MKKINNILISVKDEKIFSEIVNFSIKVMIIND